MNLELSNHAWIYQQIIENSPMGMMLVDASQPDLPIIYVNPAFERMTGYAAADVMGRNARFLQGSDREQAGLATLRQALSRVEAVTVILRNYRQDGSLFWNELHIAPIRDQAGQVTHYVGAQKDVTIREEAKLALERDERRYHQMFDSHTAIKLVIDPRTGQLLNANIAAAAFYGYSRAQLKLMRIHDLNVLPEAEIFQAMQTAVTQDRTFFEFRHRLASGEIRDVDVYASPVDTPEGRVLYVIIVDVTQKRQAVIEYMALFEQSNDAVFILDLDGRHRRVNQRAADLFGYTIAELEQLSYHELVFPPEQAATAAVLTRLRAGEQIAPYERTFRRKDGTLILGEINVEIVRDSAGQPRHYQSVVRDITERRAYEERLRESEEKYRAAVEQSLDGMLLTDETGRIIEWNRGLVNLSGLVAEDVFGQPIWDVQFRLAPTAQRTPAHYAALKTMIQTALQTGQVSWTPAARDTLIECADGSLRSVQASVFPIKTVNGYRFGSIMRDNTERTRMEDALRQSEEKYRAVVEQSLDGIMLTDETGNVIEWNRGMVTLSGLTTEEVFGQPIWDVQFQIGPTALRTPAYYTALKAMIQAALQTGSASWLMEPRDSFLQRADGSLHSVQASMFPIKTANGYRLGSIVRDITQRKMMEDALRQSEARLRSLLQSETALVLRTDLLGNYTYVNPAFADWYGCQAAELLHHSALENIDVIDYPKLYAAVATCSAQPDKAVQVTLTKHLQNGDKRYTLWEFIALTDENGQPTEIQCMGFDITQQRDLETALLLSETRYHAALEASMDAYYLLESVRDVVGNIVDFRIVQVNGNAVREMGLPAEQLIGALICELLPINRIGGFCEAYKQVVETGTALDEEYQIPDDHTASGWYQHQVTRVGDGVAIMNRNITERKQAEEARKVSEERLQTIVDHIPVMISFYDPVGNFEFANRFWVDRLGWTIEDIQTASDPLTLFYPDPAYRQRVLEYMLSGAQGWHDFQSMTKYRGELRTSWWNVRLSDGRSIGIGQDITERYQMEQALRESEEKFRMIAENVSDGIVIFDAQSQVAYASPNFERQYGRRPGASIGLSLDAFVEVVHPDDRSLMLKRIEEAIEQRAETLTLMYRLRHSNGSYFWQEDRARFIYSPDGEFLCTYVVARDITERKQVEETERRLWLEKERLRLLTRFFQEAAHEFSTPLSTLSTGIYLLSRSHDAERRALKAQQMTAEIDRINKLIQSTLTIMKVENADRLDRLPVDLGELVLAECRSVERNYPGRIAVELAIEPELPSVLGDAEYLGRAFTELLDNAYRFTPEAGSVKVSISGAPTQILVEITDTGSGIPEADLPHIFDIFWRNDEVHTTAGFGLGLAIAQRIIEQHGGTITVASVVGRVPSFGLRLPSMASPW